MLDICCDLPNNSYLCIVKSSSVDTNLVAEEL